MSDKSIKPQGTVMPAGQLSDALVAYLEGKGVKLATRQISITDRCVLRMLRPAMIRDGRALPERTIRRMLSIFRDPKAVLWDKRSKQSTLLFVFEVEGEERLGQFSVKIRCRDRRAQRQKSNFVAMGSLVDRANLERRGQIILGEL